MRLHIGQCDAPRVNQPCQQRAGQGGPQTQSAGTTRRCFWIHPAAFDPFFVSNQFWNGSGYKGSRQPSSGFQSTPAPVNSTIQSNPRPSRWPWANGEEGGATAGSPERDDDGARECVALPRAPNTPKWAAFFAVGTFWNRIWALASHFTPQWVMHGPPVTVDRSQCALIQPENAAGLSFFIGNGGDGGPHDAAVHHARGLPAAPQAHAFSRAQAPGGLDDRDQAAPRRGPLPPALVLALVRLLQGVGWMR